MFFVCPQCHKNHDGPKSLVQEEKILRCARCRFLWPAAQMFQAQDVSPQEDDFFQEKYSDKFPKRTFERDKKPEKQSFYPSTPLRTKTFLKPFLFFLMTASCAFSVLYDPFDLKLMHLLSGKILPFKKAFWAFSLKKEAVPPKAFLQTQSEVPPKKTTRLSPQAIKLIALDSGNQTLVKGVLKNTHNDAVHIQDLVMHCFFDQKNTSLTNLSQKKIFSAQFKKTIDKTLLPQESLPFVYRLSQKKQTIKGLYILTQNKAKRQN